MKITGDIRSPRLLHFKGFCFFLLGLIAGGLLLLESPTLRTAGLLVIAIWAFCRFYYFLFHVLEAYAGRGRPYAGLWDALSYCLRSREKSPPARKENLFE
jgi:hypothetical protein